MKLSKKNTQTAEIFLETTFGFKKTATQKFETTFGFTKTTQTSISRSKSSSKSSSNEFQNLKFWCRAIWNKFQILKYAKMSIFFGIKSPVFMEILLLDPFWNLKNQEKPRFFRFVKLPYRIDQNLKNFEKKHFVKSPYRIDQNSKYFQNCCPFVKSSSI